MATTVGLGVERDKARGACFGFNLPVMDVIQECPLVSQSGRPSGCLPSGGVNRTATVALLDTDTEELSRVEKSASIHRSRRLRKE